VCAGPAGGEGRPVARRMREDKAKVKKQVKSREAERRAGGAWLKKGSRGESRSVAREGGA